MAGYAAESWLSVRQLGALLRRQWLLKSRSWQQTLGEFLSPTLLMGALVLGSSLATVTDFEPAVFTNSTASARSGTPPRQAASQRPPADASPLAPPPKLTQLLSNLSNSTAYRSASTYFLNSTAYACPSSQYLVTLAAPGLASTLGADTAALAAAASTPQARQTAAAWLP